MHHSLFFLICCRPQIILLHSPTRLCEDVNVIRICVLDCLEKIVPSVSKLTNLLFIRNIIESSVLSNINFKMILFTLNHSSIHCTTFFDKIIPHDFIIRLENEIVRHDWSLNSDISILCVWVLWWFCPLIYLQEKKKKANAIPI